jgi:serine phosphatase RsbU (regulator of sigma subunit)
MAMQEEIKSSAFKEAALRSEKARVVGLIGFLGACLVIAAWRGVIAETSVERWLVLSAAELIGLLMIYEVFVWRILKTRVEEGRPLSVTAYAANLFVETLLPTGLLLVVVINSPVGRYLSLVAPVGVVYYFFIILSTLRLSPGLSRLTGLFSAVGYLAVVVFTYNRYPYPEAPGEAFGLIVYITYAVFLLLAGFVAGAVAGEIRKHVVAALREAEVRRQMERIEHDLSIARSIQMGLLPEEMPKVDGYDIAGWNQPADETGGDYFDWQQLSDGRLAISLADVSGHGIGPALVTAACRAYARATLTSNEGLGEELGRINKLLVEDLPPDRFVTFVVGVLDPEQGRVDLLSAGHAPLLLYRAAEDRIESFDAHGIPFGLMDGIPYGPPQSIDLAPGDALVLVTDGFIEWANAEEEEFGEDRVGEIVRSSRELSAADVIDRLHREVVEFAGTVEQQDDLTAVIIKRTA